MTTTTDRVTVITLRQMFDRWDEAETVVLAGEIEGE